MADVWEKDLAQKSSLTTSDFIRVVGSDNVSYKQQLSNVLSAMRITPYTNITTLGTADLNTWRLSGIYIQNAWANATTERHYPVAGTIGFLEVIAYPTDTERVMQRYTTPSCDVYVRIRDYDGTWYDWVKEPTRAEVDSLNSKTQSTITAASGWTAGDVNKCTKVNQMVSLDYWCSTSTATVRQWTTIGTVPSNYRPAYAFDFVAVDNSGVTSGVQTKIESTGAIKVYLTDNRSLGLRLHAVYMT